MRLGEVETQALQANMTGILSPELGCTLVWFFSHWATSFLLTSEALYGEVSTEHAVTNPPPACVAYSYGVPVLVFPVSVSDILVGRKIT
jgi:hypothetical protein